jgi:hypothetical protein
VEQHHSAKVQTRVQYYNDIVIAPLASLTYVCHKIYNMCSVLIYGIHIWSSASPSNYSCLKLKQKAAVRIIFGANYNDHTEPIFKLLNILPLDDLCKFFDLQFMQQFLQDFLPDSFKDMWSLNSVRRNEDFHIALRDDEIYAVPFARTSLTERQPLTRIPKTWCNFPCENIKFIRNKKEFNCTDPIDLIFYRERASQPARNKRRKH